MGRLELMPMLFPRTVLIALLASLPGCRKASDDPELAKLRYELNRIQLGQAFNNEVVTFGYFSEWEEDGIRRQSVCVALGTPGERRQEHWVKPELNRSEVFAGNSTFYMGSAWKAYCSHPLPRANGEPLVYEHWQHVFSRERWYFGQLSPLPPHSR